MRRNINGLISERLDNSTFVFLFLSMALVMILTFIFMSIFELTKQTLDPNIEIWTSHVFTIIFVTIVATILSFFITFRFIMTKEKVALEHKARIIAEELLENSKNESQVYLDLIGHDINNLNQISLGYLEMFLDSPRLDVNDRMLLGKAYDAIQNSSQVIYNIRNVQRVRLGENRLQTVDLSKVIMDVKTRYAHVRGRNVTINFIPVDGCYVKANDIITDVFCNIVGNAIRHSPPEKPLFIDIDITNVKDNDHKLLQSDGCGQRAGYL
jgi:signal transduction histidine kinase